MTLSRELSLRKVVVLPWDDELMPRVFLEAGCSSIYVLTSLEERMSLIDVQNHGKRLLQQFPKMVSPRNVCKNGISPSGMLFLNKCASTCVNMGKVQPPLLGHSSRNESNLLGMSKTMPSVTR